MKSETSGGEARRPWRPVHYLGSKLRFLDPITSVIDEVSSGGIVADLFAGSGAVSMAISGHRAVWANDIQEYSRTICSAVLAPPLVEGREPDVASAALSTPFAGSLGSAVSALVELESEAIERASTGDLSPLSMFAEGLRTGRGDRNTTSALERFNDTLRTIDVHQSRTAVLRHFGGTYFSVKQAYVLTCLLAYARDVGGTRDQDQLLAATLSTASDIVNSVGKQFAQPIRMRSKDGEIKIAVAAQVHRNFSIDVRERYSRWLERYRSIPRSSHNHLVTRLDFRSALFGAPADLSLVYADPPYTREHYSRYYHVLETMCLGDDPAISDSNLAIGSSRGIYRADRHQSPFCIASQAPAAFSALFEGVAGLGVPLILSYSPPSVTEKTRTRVMPLDQIKAIGLRYFRSVDVSPIAGSKHSRLNRADLSSSAAEGSEVLLAFV